eukprot:TRINITY_DN256_c0_g1_i2.p1 TRINITY_DN256_c0_g1~~TRINITY_DN256_c0_g1_i2.p1  ORF type:complete len:348 (-),score=123.39 TRINITY_DN256_c0_g1_i2:83-1126(-)
MSSQERSKSKDKKPKSPAQGAERAASPAGKKGGAASPAGAAASPSRSKSPAGKGGARATSPKPTRQASGKSPKKGAAAAAAAPAPVVEEKKVEVATSKKGGAAKGPNPRFITVPETILKRRKRTELHKSEARKKKEEIIKKRSATQKLAFVRAEQYVKEYRDAEVAEIRLRREARKAGNFYIPPEAKVAFVVRIRGINAVPPKVRKILQLLRLRQIHNGVFIKINQATMNMVRMIEPYVTFGYPNLKTIRDLVYKRGYVKINRSRIPLTNNDLVEANLGKVGIICVEDMIHELVTCGPHFKEVSNFLWPFKLSPPKGGYVKKRVHYNEGGDFGNREELINEFVKKML